MTKLILKWEYFLGEWKLIGKSRKVLARIYPQYINYEKIFFLDIINSDNRKIKHTGKYPTFEEAKDAALALFPTS